jgi:trk system potassium uptake protein TrkA
MVLQKIDLSQVELLIAVTDRDEVNMISALTAKQLGVARTVARIRNPIYLRGTHVQYRDLLGIDLVISPEIVTAMKVVEVVLTPGAVEVESFVHGKVQLLQLVLTERCPILGRPLKNFEVPPGFILTAIERGGEVLIACGDDELMEGDRIWVAAIRDRRAEAYEIFGTTEPEAHRVAVLGSGEIPRIVAEELTKAKVQVKLFERNYDKCVQVSEDIPGIQVIHGDGTDTDLLREEGIPEYDHFICLSTEEVQNILAALVSKDLGVTHAVALVNRRGFTEVLEGLGVDTAVSPRLLTASTILRFLRRGRVVSMAKISEGRAEILEVVIHARSRVAGKTLTEAGFPKGMIVGALEKKDGTVIIPRGHDRLEPDDHAVFFILPDVVKEVEHLLA